MLKKLGNKNKNFRRSSTLKELIFRVIGSSGLTAQHVKGTAEPDLLRTTLYEGNFCLSQLQNVSVNSFLNNASHCKSVPW